MPNILDLFLHSFTNSNLIINFTNLGMIELELNDSSYTINDVTTTHQKAIVENKLRLCDVFLLCPMGNSGLNNTFYDFIHLKIHGKR